MKPIFVQVKKDCFDIFLHHKDAVSGNYMHYSFKHSYKPFKGSDIQECQNQDLWRLESLYDYKMDADGTMKLYTDYELVNPGEWECAIRIKDTYDFHGGYHGSECLTELIAEADGKKLDINENKSFYADEVCFYQKSNIYRQLTEDSVIAEHEKYYTFSKDGLRICQTLKWLSSEIIEYAYLTMLPIERHSASGDVITDKARINGVDKVYDVSKIGHEEASKRRKDVHKAEIWSEESGIYAKVSILKGLMPTNDFFIQNNPVYNKFYFSFAGDGGKHKTEIGEVWNIESHYDIYRFNEYKQI